MTTDPTTAAGRARLDEWWPTDNVRREQERDRILAIEAEARAAALDEAWAAVDGLPGWGSGHAETIKLLDAVLAAIDALRAKP